MVLNTDDTKLPRKVKAPGLDSYSPKQTQADTRAAPGIVHSKNLELRWCQKTKNATSDTHRLIKGTPRSTPKPPQRKIITSGCAGTPPKTPRGTPKAPKDTPRHTKGPPKAPQRRHKVGRKLAEMRSATGGTFLPTFCRLSANFFTNLQATTLCARAPKRAKANKKGTHTHTDTHTHTHTHTHTSKNQQTIEKL